LKRKRPFIDWHQINTLLTYQSQIIPNKYVSMPAKNQKKRMSRPTPIRTYEVLDVKMAAELLTVSPDTVYDLFKSSAGSFSAGKSVENGSPPGMRCCAGLRAHRRTIRLPRPSNAVIGMPSPLPSNLARRRSRKGKQRLLCLLPYYISIDGKNVITLESYSAMMF
jgi:hypothetical protein